MQLISIATISNGRDTIGFRILDIDTKQVKDVPVNSIRDVLASGNIQIDNLEVKDGVVVGSNGSIERLPKLVGGQLVGKSPLIVISQLGDIGYKVSDFKGNVMNLRNADIISYAKTNGIANGKIINRESREFISSINGVYRVEQITIPSDKSSQAIDNEKIKKTTNTTKNGERYTGEKLEELEPLLPVVRLTGIYNYIRSGNEPLDNMLISYRNGKVHIENATYMIRTLNKGIIQKGLVYHTDKYTIAGKIYRYIKTTDETKRNELEDILRIEEVRKAIDEEINNMIKIRGAKGRKDADTGILVPTKKEWYNDIVVKEKLNRSENNYDMISMLEVDKYIQYLKVMESNVYGCVQLDIRRLALARNCTSKGINYSVIEPNIRTNILDLTIEDIYLKADEYDNVTVNGDEMTIVGLDGAYKYNMETIKEVYKRYEVKSKRSMKAAMVDPNYIERVEANGDLQELRCSLQTINIPSNVKAVLPESIIVSNKTEAIIFGDNIDRCSAKCFSRSGFGGAQLKYIEIKSNKKVGLAVLKSLENFNGNKRCSITLKYIRDISPEEYAYTIYMDKISTEIQSNNIQNMDDTFILGIIKSIIATKLDNLKTAKDCKVKKLGEMQIDYRTMRRLWESRLRDRASESLKETISNLLIEVEKILSLRPRV